MSLTLLGAGPSGVGVGGGGGAWLPTVLGSALRAWYKTDILTGSNTDPQSTIVDSSGNGFDLTQAGTLRATLAAADLNSLNTLRFTAASFQRYPISASVMNGLSSGSVYIVYKGVATATNYGLLNIGTSGNDSHYPFSDNNFYNDFGSTVRKSCGAATNSVTSYRILSIYSAASDWALFVDGGTGGSSGGTTALFSTGTNTVGWQASGNQLGSNFNLNTFLNGWIAEVFFTNAKQSTTDRQKAEGYLAHKWGITGNLDSAHPYKSAAP